MRQDRSEHSRRGRPRSFDLDAATAAALSTLWDKGYEGTTVGDLVQATGLAPSSLYAAFGSKHGVLEAALARYDRDREDLLRPLEHGSSGLADLSAFLDAVRSGLTEPGPPGCFMVTTATEVAPRDERIAERARRYGKRVREGIATALDRAVARGEILPGDVADRARLLQAAFVGVQVTARCGATDEALAVVESMRRQVERWAAPQAR
ncbi:TetR/AcrR family transcriptional regulator [Nocardiopsis sp. LOL_012]|uniref:TetR/AcrR family transcriptional regulator n=1 Tax=Nocardiopsis sp. LOL_012 TaxID=3345409 RepID=UPI003A88281B